MKAFLFATILALTTVAAAQNPITGDWAGTLDAGTAKLHLLLHITAAPDGSLKATMDSVDQGANGIPVTSATLTGDKLTLVINAVHGGYTGTLSKDGSELHGAWTQGADLPLNFHRATPAAIAAAAPRRPQNPTKPYPYKSEDLTYTNTLQHDVLAATLTIPPGKGPFPAVVLITGSGAQDRDESLMGHKPFLVLSDYLTRHGIIVLRADDRGTAKSTGNFATATTADFATDTEAGIAFLKSRPEVDPHRIGLIGHSEGGVIAPMIAARNPDVAFIVLLAGTGLPGIDIITEQTRLLSLAASVTPQVATANADQEHHLLTLIVDSKDDTTLNAKLTAELTADGIPESQIPATIKSLTSPWYRYFLAYDPATALRHVKCPVLALDGSKDTQVPSQQNLAAIHAALTAAGNTHFETDELPGLNHLFQTATTGAVSEYATIDETMSPTALNKISTWILQQP